MFTLTMRNNLVNTLVIILTMKKVQLVLHFSCQVFSRQKLVGAS
jgi:hypothetical protein